ncbi:hypothetical protein V1226_06645 [Lachnospiraceae bacterium JLR.KK009]|nr:hypothetical protein C810_00921 [Lachnospiraceae bacterium A2]
MKKRKGKAAKKAMKFAERKAKAEKWVVEYDGTPYGGDIIKAYRKKFAVDRMKAVAELQLLGVSLTNEQIDREKEAVKAYQELQRVKKAKRKRIREQKRMKKDNPVFHEEQDDTFYYIAGYTSGGAPYGVTWEEMGFKS